jgi:hypothetical protein
MIESVHRVWVECKVLAPGTEMDEGRRQAYLAALAITLWTPSHELPGALAAPALEFAAFVSDVLPVALEELELPPVSATATATASATPPTTAATAFVSHVVDKTNLDAVNNGFASKTVAVVSASSDGALPRFSCFIQALAPGWMAVIALDDVPDLSAQEYRLLSNLMQALGGDVMAEAPRDHFRWPLSTNPKIARDAAAAREALAAFLARRREQARWLVLGETLAVYVRAALPQGTVVAGPTLRELLADASSKPALWKALHG